MISRGGLERVGGGGGEGGGKIYNSTVTIQCVSVQKTLLTFDCQEKACYINVDSICTTPPHPI